jgi:YHS domain-containing protein
MGPPLGPAERKDPIMHRIYGSRTLVALVALGALGLAAPSLASDEVNVSRGLAATGKPLALHGYDPVAYFTQGAPTPGSAEHSSVHEGATYYFASKENRKAFDRDPGKYSPAFGGFCAYGVSVGKKFDGDPRYWTVWQDRLYLNLNADIARKFNKNVPGNVAKADDKWSRIEHRAVADL